MPEVYTNKIGLHYEMAGSGHPLLLIPEAGYGGWFWHKVVAPLSQRYQVITPDPRGTGQTDKSQGPYTVEMLALDMAGLVDRLHCRGVYVVGHGLGAYVAQYLALNRPELVGKLVLAAGDFGGPNAVRTADEAARLAGDVDDLSLEKIEADIQLATAPGFAQRKPQIVRELVAYRMSDVVPMDSYRQQMAARAEMASAEASFEERLGQIKAPTMILFGEADRIVPPENARLLASRIPNARVVLLPNLGHLFPLEDPEATINALVEFLGGRKYPA